MQKELNQFETGTCKICNLQPICIFCKFITCSTDDQMCQMQHLYALYDFSIAHCWFAKYAQSLSCCNRCKKAHCTVISALIYYVYAQSIWFVHFAAFCSDDEDRLMIDVFRGYNPLIRPVRTENGTIVRQATEVRLGLQLLLLINVVSELFIFTVWVYADQSIVYHRKRLKVHVTSCYP